MIEIGCPQCGYAPELDEIPADLPENLLCPMCGTWISTAIHDEEAAATMPLESEDAEDTSPMDIVVIGHLQISGCPTPEEPCPLTKRATVVGREDADITVEDPTMSIRHFQIDRREEGFFIRDLESTNGTRVNGVRIETAELSSGDRIQAGLTSFVFRMQETVAPDR